MLFVINNDTDNDAQKQWNTFIFTKITKKEQREWNTFKYSLVYYKVTLKTNQVKQ